MPQRYNVNDWYWTVNNDASKAYSSKLGDYVPSNDPTFAAWLADGNKPIQMPDEIEMGRLMDAVDVSTKPIAPGVLDGFKDTQASNIINSKIFRILFQHENRIRALERSAGLSSAPDLTPAQAKAAIKQLM